MINNEMTELGLDVLGEINYVRNPPASAAETLDYFEGDEKRTTMQTLPGRVMVIRDARQQSVSLEREGFQLVHHQSGISDFEGIELNPALDARYLEELTQFLAQLTGASSVMMIGGAKQRFSKALPEKLSALVNAKPARFPHADNTDKSSLGLVQMIGSAVPDFDLKQYSRWALYNIWRCVSPAPQDCPLTLCDARSSTPADEITISTAQDTLDMGVYRHATTGFLYNPEHRWYYFPDMTSDEVIVFKTHDSDKSRPSRVAHTAFDNVLCPPDAPARISVEARALALFK